MAGNSRHDVMGATDERHQAACRAYLDNACMGRPDSKVLHEVGSLLAKLSRATQSPTDLTVDLYSYYARARKAVAGLVGADEDDIALVESTSHGLGLMAAALPCATAITSWCATWSSCPRCCAGRPAPSTWTLRLGACPRGWAGAPRGLRRPGRQKNAGHRRQRGTGDQRVPG